MLVTVFYIILSLILKLALWCIPLIVVKVMYDVLWGVYYKLVGNASGYKYSANNKVVDRAF